MSGIVDDKKYATDTRPYGTTVVQQGYVPCFEESPISRQLQMKDICIYKPGDLNKIGKEGKTSWDSFSYALLMGHNVWTHIESVQRANREYDSGKIPGMIIDERFDSLQFKDIVEAIFATNDRNEAEAIIEEYDRFWQRIIGTRGASGKKAVNARTMFGSLFEEVEEEHHIDDSGLDETKLDELENSNG
jgi:hypothetical protein